jgi:hypothetical protein
MITRKDLMQFRMQEKLESLLTLTNVVANGSITGGSGMFSDANNNTMSDGLDRKFSGSSISREISSIEKTSADEVDITHEVSTVNKFTHNASTSQYSGLTVDNKHELDERSSVDNGPYKELECNPVEFAVDRQSYAETAARSNNCPQDNETEWVTHL